MAGLCIESKAFQEFTGWCSHENERESVQCSFKTTACYLYQRHRACTTLLKTNADNFYKLACGFKPL